MITGKVSSDREATVDLEILGSNRQQQRVVAVVDTGFNGSLTLPGDVIGGLELPLVGNRRATLGDGSIVALEAYLAKVLWHELEREVLVLQAEGGPLLGMSLLYGNRVILNVVENGDVEIEVLS